MFFNFGWSSAASVFGVAVFGKYSDAWWHRTLIWPVYRFGRAIRDGIWLVRYRVDPRHRYHLINTRLKPGYYDIDDLMLNGMFSLLRRYVEYEQGGVESLEKWANELLTMDEMTHESDTAQGKGELEAIALYRWWTETRPADQNRRVELIHLLYGQRDRMTFTPVGNVNGEAIHQMHFSPDEGEEIGWHKELDVIEEKIDREETEMLHRLIDIRGGLWT